METAQRQFESGCAELETGNLAAAARLLEQALELEPGHALAHYKLGNVRREQGDAAAAERHFRSAIALAPGLAEAHNNLGVVCQVSRRFDEAEQSFRDAAAANPALAQAYLNLGRLMMQLGRRTEAEEAFSRGASGSDLPDVFAHLVAAIEGRNTASAPAEYVQATFDGYARQYDERMAIGLAYDLPRSISQAISEHRPRTDGKADILDLGCGTGLCGKAMAPLAQTLWGVDLSRGMLEVARERRCYDELFQEDIVEWMRRCPGERFDVVTAADVFIYTGDLDGVFLNVRRLLRPGGLFGFSTELSDGSDWTLGESGRYGHGPDYIERLARQHGLRFRLRAEQPLRKPIVGRLYLLARE